MSPEMMRGAPFHPRALPLAASSSCSGSTCDLGRSLAPSFHLKCPCLTLYVCQENSHYFQKFQKIQKSCSMFNGDTRERLHVQAFPNILVSDMLTVFIKKKNHKISTISFSSLTFLYQISLAPCLRGEFISTTSGRGSV